MKRDRIKSITLSALFVSIIAVSAQMAIPTPAGLSITLQTFAVSLCGFYLGASKALLSVVTYIVLGAVGVPVFSGFSGGLGIILGKSGGFITGFIFLSIFCAFSEKSRLVLKSVLCLLGILICHTIGCIYFSYVTDCSLKSAVILTSLPFILKDIMSVVLAYLFSQKLKKRIKIQSP